MKLSKTMVSGILIISLLLLYGLWYSFVRKPRSTEVGTLTYEQLCIQNGDQWMEMEETRKGKTISNTLCFGCMIADNHFCNVKDYIEYVKSLPSFIR